LLAAAVKLCLNLMNDFDLEGDDEVTDLQGHHGVTRPAALTAMREKFLRMLRNATADDGVVDQEEFEQVVQVGVRAGLTTETAVRLAAMLVLKHSVPRGPFFAALLTRVGLAPPAKEGAPGPAAPAGKRVLSRKTMRLEYADPDAGKRTLKDIVRDALDKAGQPDANDMASQFRRAELLELRREALDALSPVAEDAAVRFFKSVGVDRFVRVTQDPANKLFQHMAARGRLGAEFGECHYLSFGAAGTARPEALYVHQTDKGGSGYGLLVCKLTDGGYVCSNTLGDGAKILR
jgi:hypothetical protein